MPNLTRTCTIDGCEKKHLASGMCSMHYTRVRNLGSTELAERVTSCSVEECDSGIHGYGYCVKHYKRWKKYGDPLHVASADCITCGERFLLGTRGKPSVVCAECREVARRESMYLKAREAAAKRYEEERRFATCAHCHDPFERLLSDTKSFLCVGCKAVERLCKAREWDRLNPQPMTDAKRAQLKAYKHRRRVIERSAHSDRFLAAEIYERDDWSCQICGLQIDPTEKFPSRDSASLDHIIPLALGGTHTLDNVQMACMGCNWMKGARMST